MGNEGGGDSNVSYAPTKIPINHGVIYLRMNGKH